MIADHEIETTILELAAARGAGKTVCPSEVARHLGGDRSEEWRSLMAPIKRVAVRLATDGRIAILRGGRPVPDLDDLRGIYRIGPPAPAAEGKPAPATSRGPAPRRS